MKNRTFLFKLITMSQRGNIFTDKNIGCTGNYFNRDEHVADSERNDRTVESIYSNSILNH